MSKLTPRYELRKVRKLKAAAIKAQNFYEAANLREREKELIAILGINPRRKKIAKVLVIPEYIPSLIEKYKNI